MDYNIIKYPLTQPQKRIWATQKIYIKSPMFTIGGIVDIKGTINPDILNKAICTYINTHDAFRIRIMEDNHQPMQYFSETFIREIEYKDFSNDSKEIFDKWCKTKLCTSFKIENEPLYEIIIYKRNSEHYGFLTRLHHIIADGWSVQLLSNGISSLYEQLYNGTYVEDKEIPKYLDSILAEQEYLKSEKYQKNKNYWNKVFSILPECIPHSTYHVKGSRKSFYLSAQLTEMIVQLCKNYNVTENTFFISLYLLYMYKTIGQSDIIIGIPVLGRQNKKERNTFGMFVSSLPFRFTVNSGYTIKEMIKSVNLILKECYANQKYPYNQLLKDLELTSHGVYSLYSTSINFYGTSMSKLMNGSPVITTELYNGEQEYELQIIIRKWESNNYQLDFDYKKDIYTEKDINRMYETIELLIYNIISSYEDTEIKDICLLNQQEKQVFLNDFNNTDYNIIEPKTILEQFERQILLTPNRIAVNFEKESITYIQLSYKVNQVASYLQKKRVAENVIVGLLIEYSLDTLSIILGILKSGAAYLPISPELPEQRITYILDEADVSILITNIEVSHINKNNIQIEYVKDILANKNEYVNIPEISSNSLAYVIYTSGSTGKPKGVKISHKNLINYIMWAKKTYITHENEIFPLYSSLSFDLTITSLFVPLVSGGTINIYSDNQDEYVLYRILKENKCTIIKLTPSHLYLMKDYDNRKSSIKKLIVGGEKLPTKLAKEVFESFCGDVEIYNEYGPTEATIGCMIHKYDVKEDIGDSVPIGKPISNMKIYILDKDQTPTPIFEVGEIFITGMGVSNGYLNQPNITKERFIINKKIDTSIMYKTGDFARFNDKQQIEYIGRCDEQINMRGYRIELGEIENALQNYTDIKKAVVVDILYGDSYYLCAYYTSQSDIEEHYLREFLQARLPEYMIPTYFIKVNDIPLTLNGKVDKTKLKYPQIPLAITEEKSSLSEIQKFVLSIFSDVLGIEDISLNNNFFQLGGDSIKAIQAASKFIDNGYSLSASDILSHPDFSEISYILDKKEKQSYINKKCTGVLYPTPIIKWFFSQPIKNLNYYCQYIQLRLKQNIKTSILQKVLFELIEHHDNLRLNYNFENKVLSYNDITISDIQIEEGDIPKEDLAELLTKNMDISKAPLIHSGVYYNSRECIWCIVINHIAIDGISWRILLEDIDTLLEQAIENRKFILPQKSISYQEWAEKVINISENNKHHAWEYLLFQSKEKKEINESDGNYEYLQSTAWITEDVTTKLFCSVSSPYHIKPIEKLLAALVYLISNKYNKKEMMIEIETHGRDNDLIDLNIYRTVGWFTNILPLIIETEILEISQCIKIVKEQYRYMKEQYNYKDKQPLIRFNYLGELRTEYNLFSVEPIMQNQNDLTCSIEMDILLINKKLFIAVRAIKNSLIGIDIQNFLLDFKKSLIQTIEHCEVSDIQFTPSDFSYADITQEDLDILFK